jgi:5'-nucleotidase (lipoprotein e(P4) family)
MIAKRIDTLCAILVLVGGACATRTTGVGSRPASTAPTAPQARALRDTHEMLDGVLWMQTSAEYAAIASATYDRAAATLSAAIEDRSWTAALEQTGPYADLPPAVILDLDETVLDNSRFQGQLVLDRGTYQPAAWSDWVSRAEATLVPGAKEFIDAAARSNVRLFFVTSRTLAEEPDTVRNLRDLGLDVTPDEVLSKGEGDGSSDKSGRRALVARSHRILLLVGDDLGDFVSSAGLSPTERLSLVREHREWWSTRWVLLPNPLYGSWERALYPGIEGDAAVLEEKRSRVHGYR